MIRVHLHTRVTIVASFLAISPAFGFPTPETQSLLDLHAGLRAMPDGSLVSVLYGTRIAIRNPATQPTVDDFVEDFITLPANCDALGVAGATLVPDKFCTGKPMVKCGTANDCAAGETCGHNIDAGDGRFRIYHFVQTIEGLPVYGSLVKIPVRLESPEYIHYVGISLKPKPAPGVTLPIDIKTSGDATALVDADPMYPTASQFSTPEKVIYVTPGGKHHRTWKFYGYGGSESVLFFLDTNAGNIVSHTRQQADLPVSGRVTGWATPNFGADDGQVTLQEVGLGDATVRLVPGTGTTPCPEEPGLTESTTCPGALQRPDGVRNRRFHVWQCDILSSNHKHIDRTMGGGS